MGTGVAASISSWRRLPAELGAAEERVPFSAAVCAVDDPAVVAVPAALDAEEEARGVAAAVAVATALAAEAAAAMEAAAASPLRMLAGSIGPDDGEALSGAAVRREAELVAEAGATDGRGAEAEAAAAAGDRPPSGWALVVTLLLRTRSNRP
jgi:hypothetical protein